MAAELDQLSAYYNERGNSPRAAFYASLAQIERAEGGPESIAFSLEGKGLRGSVEIGGKTAKQLKTELEKAGVSISKYAQPQSAPIPLQLEDARAAIGRIPTAGGIRGAGLFSLCASRTLNP